MLLRLDNIGKIYNSNDLLLGGIRGINLEFDYMIAGTVGVTSMGIAGEMAESNLLLSEGNGSLRIKRHF